MKITDQLLSITVKQGRGSSALFSDLRPGDRITAQIIQTQGNSALLEFRGRRITADFISGVPEGNSVELILSEKTPERVAFTIAGKPVPHEFMELLQSISILSGKGVEDIPVHSLMKFLGSGKVDLFTLNLFLAGIKKDDRGKPAADLFNSLLKRGISFDTLADLSFILAGRGGASIISAFFFFTGIAGKNQGRLKNDALDEQTDDICRAFSGDEEALKEVISLLTGDDREVHRYGEIPFPDDDKFSSFKYMQHEGGFFFDMEFSALGRIYVSVKGDKSSTFISFFSDNDEIIEFARERMGILERNLELMDIKKPFIKFNNSKKMIDKLDVWRTDFYIKREFDVRI